jgi:hypothetical protein
VEIGIVVPPQGQQHYGDARRQHQCDRDTERHSDVVS